MSLAAPICGFDPSLVVVVVVSGSGALAQDTRKLRWSRMQPLLQVIDGQQYRSALREQLSASLHG